MVKLCKFGDPILEKCAAEIKVFDAALKQRAEEMYKLMIDNEGLGLAGPQAGLSERIFVIDMRCRRSKDEPCEMIMDGRKLPVDINMPLYAVNPQVEEIGEYLSTGEEGCLSFPGIYVEKTRSEQVRLKYFDLSGNPHTIECDGLFARCIQHENDHLDGITIADNLHPRQYAKIEAKLKKLKRLTRDELKSGK